MPRVVRTAPRNVIARTQNLFVRSQEFDNAAWALLNVTLSPNAAVAPDGTVTACGVTDSVDGGAVSHVIQQSSVTSAGGTIYTASVYAKAAASGTWLCIYADSGNVLAYFDLNNGVPGTYISVGSNGAGWISTGMQNVGNGWYRCSVTFRSNDASNSSSINQFRPITANGSTTYQGTGVLRLYLWGAQITQADHLTSYVKTVSTPYNVGVPRNVISATQNLLKFSEEFDNAVWSPQSSNCAASANLALAPDGTISMDGIVATSTASGTKYLGQAELNSAGAFAQPGWQTFSCYLKAGAVNWAFMMQDGTFQNTFFDLVNGAIGTINNGGGTVSGSYSRIEKVPGYPGIWRCSITSMRTHVNQTIRIGACTANGVDTYAASDTVTPQIYCWGAQLSQSNGPVPYIKTRSLPYNVSPVRNIIPKQQNLLTRSEDMSNASSWTASAATLTAAAIAAPLEIGGRLNAAKITETATTALHLVRTTIINMIPYSQYTLSVYIKDGNRGFAGFTTGNGAVIFNLTNGTVQMTSTSGTSIFVSANIVRSDNDWWRCSMTFIPSVPNSSAFMQFLLSDGVGTNPLANYAGSTSNFVYMVGAQLNLGNRPTPYIATDAAAVDFGASRNIVT